LEHFTKDRPKTPYKGFFFNWIVKYLYKQGVEDMETWNLLQEAQLGAHRKQLARQKRDSEKEHRKAANGSPSWSMR
jgi:hypothetical protein